MLFLEGRAEMWLGWRGWGRGFAKIVSKVKETAHAWIRTVIICPKSIYGRNRMACLSMRSISDSNFGKKRHSLHQRCFCYMWPTFHFLNLKNCLSLDWFSPLIRRRAKREAAVPIGEAGRANRRWTCYNQEQKESMFAVVQPSERQKRGKYFG